jgi:hypothetical protein
MSFKRELFQQHIYMCVCVCVYVCIYIYTVMVNTEKLFVNTHYVKL